jgi:hypothetical protein
MRTINTSNDDDATTGKVAEDGFPDIEIYIKRPSLDALLAWIEVSIGPTSHTTRGTATQVLLPDQTRCIIVENAVKGGFTSVWFKSDKTPWATDRDCALAAWLHFQIETRCSSGGWNGLDEQGWLRFTDAGETVVNWFV